MSFIRHRRATSPNKFEYRNIDETAQLIAEYGIVASEAIAKKALPKCHIVCYINNNMRSALEGFLQVLYDQNPKSVGGSMPKDDFYYEY